MTTKIPYQLLEDGTAGEIFTWDATGAPATVAVGTAGQVLTSNGAGAAPTFQNAAGGGGDLLAANNLSDVASAATSRINLGLQIGVDVQAFDANNAVTDVAQAYTAQQNFAEATLVDGANIAWNLDIAQAATVTLAGNRTLDNPTNQVAGGVYVLRIVQDGTGTRTLTFDTAYSFPGGTPPTLSTGGGDVDILTFYSDGTTMHGVIGSAGAGGGGGGVTEAVGGPYTGTQIDASSQIIFAHGLGVIPDLVLLEMECLSADQGYTAGQRVRINIGGDHTSVSHGISTVVDATNVTLRISNNALVLTNPTTGNVGGIVEANWNLRIYAYDDLTVGGGGASGSKVLLGTYTAVGGETSIDIGSGLDLDAAIDGTYDKYILEGIGIIAATDSVIPQMRTSTDTGTSFDATSYDWRLDGGRIGQQIQNSVTGDTEIWISENANSLISNVSSEPFNFEVTVYKPADAAKFTTFRIESCGVNAASNEFHTEGVASRTVAEATDALRYFHSAGNITSGTFKLYGIN